MVEHAAGALRNLCNGSNACKDEIVAFGALQRLVLLLKHPSAEAAKQAAWALANLTIDSTTRWRQTNALDAASSLRLLRHADPSIAKQAADTLQALCRP